MKKNFIIIALLLLTYEISFSQTIGRRSPYGRTDTIKVISFMIIGNDTIPYLKLDEVTILSPRIFAKKRDQRKYNRLVYNVKKVYPYAKLAGEKLRYYEFMMNGMSDSERKKFTKRLERDLNDEFGEELKNLNFTQGKILLKLIDRETKNTPYSLLVDLRGVVRAFFWNGLASLFGYNLKENYDPLKNEEDKMIEEIVQMINSGVL